MRKKIYLVREDEKRAYGPENWIIMDGKQFLKFIRSKDGKRRSQNFATLKACTKDDYMIVVECGEEKAKEIRKENDHRDYLLEQQTDMGYEICSYETMNKEGCFDDIIGDPDMDIERFVIDRCMCKLIRECVSKLSKEEQKLVKALYLSKDLCTEREYGVALGLSQQTVHNMKIRVLRKLRKMVISSKCL